MNKPVAIIGFAFRLPGGSDEKLWQRLKAGDDLVTEVPEGRWSKAYFLHPDKTEPGRSYTFAAGTLGDISGFDASFFGISPREAEQMDPQQRLLLEMTWEAFESGGIPPSTQRGSRTAVYIGYSGSDYSYRRADDLSITDASSMTGNTGSVAANRISYWFDLHGPSMAVDTACSSSLVAFHQAWQAIQTGEVNQAIVGGVSLHMHPMPFVGFSKASMLSPTGRCRVFDADGDGYVRSEGGGVFLLKDLAEAKADGDHIFAEVAGVGSNCDGRTNGITIPSRDAQADLLKSVYAKAGIKPAEIDYVEAHGTGTQVGDPIEAASIGAVLGKGRDADRPLLVGSVKSNLGHLETASGVAGLVKALYCLENREVPASLHLETPNPHIPIDELNLKVVTENTELPADGTLTIGVNSFGFGGANAHVVLRSHENAPASTAATSDNGKQPMPALLLSAADRAALRALAGRYADLLRLSPEIDTYQLAFNAFRHRDHLGQRLMLPAADRRALLRALDKYSRGEVGNGVVEGEALDESSAPVFVYSGNGSQWAGMGQVLLEHDPVFRAEVETVDRLLQAIGGNSVLDDIARTPGEDRYEMTEVAQPALFAVQVGITMVLRRHGIEPAATVGHSVGEVAAAWACGALSLEQAVHVIHARSQAQGSTRGSGAMTAVALSDDETIDLLRDLGLSDRVAVAGINSPRGVTVAGAPEALRVLEDRLEEREVFHRRLPLDYAFHSPSMDAIETEIHDELAGLRPAAQGVFVSTVTGDVLAGSALDADYWWRNIREPVRFRSAIEVLAERGFNLFVEIGPHPVLRNYVTDTLRKQDTECRVIETLVRNDERPARLDETVGKVLLAAPLDVWGHFFEQPAPFLALPRYAWQREVFWPPPTAESDDNIHRHFVHPLLGFRVADERLAWEGRLDLRVQPALADHRVGDSVLFPAAGFAELALAAAAQREPGSAHTIEDLEIFAPLVLEPGVTKRIRFQVDAHDGRFEIISNARLSDEPWMHHAVGRLVTGGGRQPAREPLVLPARPFDFDATQHYQLTARVGLQYGPAYQVVNGVWRDGDRLTGRLCPPADSDVAGYRLLPALLDGCFQVLADYSAEEILGGDNDALVPVRIDSLITLREGVLPTFASGRLVRRSDRSAVVDFDLYDADRTLIASLTGVRFRRVKLVREAANRHWLGYRLLPRPRSTEGAVTGWATPETLAESTALQGGMDERYVNEFLPLLDVLCAAYAERALRELGAGSATLSAQVLTTQGRLQTGQLKLFEQLTERLLDEEAVEEAPDGVRWVPDAGLPDPEMIWQRLLRDYPDHAAQTMLVGRAGRCLPQVLRGERDGASLVAAWADGAALSSYLSGALVLRQLDQWLGNLLDRLSSTAVAQSRPLRVLLVLDRRTAVTTRLLRWLDEAVFELTIVRNIERRPDAVDALLEHTPGVRLVEVAFDQLPQNWSLGNVPVQDLLLVDHALSRFADPEAVLTWLRTTLRRDGIVALSDHAPIAWIDFVFGLAPEWWTSGYHDQITFGTLALEEIEELLDAAGFESAKHLELDGVGNDAGPTLYLARSPDAGTAIGEPVSSPPTCLIIQDASGYSASLGEAVRETLLARGSRVIPVLQGSRAGNSSTVFHVDTGQPEAWPRLFERLRDSALIPEAVLWLSGLDPDAPRPSDPGVWSARQAQRCAEIGQFFTALSATDLEPDCWLVTSGAFVAETPAVTDGAMSGPSPDALVWGFGRCLINEFSGFGIRLVDLAAPHRLTQMRDGLVDEVLAPTGDDEIVFGERGREVGRVTVVDPERPLTGAMSKAYDVALKFDMPGPLTGLYWEACQPQQPGAGELAIEVRAAGLNFRDVMYAMGLLSDEAVEAGFAGATLGMELSGVVAEVGEGVTEFAPGDAVIAFAPASFSTRTITSANAVIAKPADWSFAAAATVPTTFFTVFYALHELARLRPGERVLIHGAAGGVGIAAIQLAQHLGAEIFATAGSPDKRDFVRQLGVEHVFDSRSLDFADEILECTGGDGVDVVLNSLAGEAINRNLKALRPFGRFLELGKRDFYENTRIGLRPFRNNISYFGIDADQLMAERPELTRRLFRELFELFDADVLQPLPFTRFAADDAVEAFRFMQQAKQIGKIVLTFDQAPRAKVSRLPRVAGPALPADATYLITGGTGGFGAATARWLVAQGARHLVLLSRQGAAAPDVDTLIAELEKIGADVQALACDVTDRDALAAVLNTIEAMMPPLRGVIHAAMVIDDGLVSDLDEERINKVFAPKVLGALHLDALTRDAALDFFVVYSSATTSFGNPGQASYVAANRFLEYLIERRRADGLAGLAVSWGPLEDVGYLARNQGVGEALESRLGGRSLTAEQALDTLGTLLRGDRSGVAVLNFDWARLRRSLPAASAARFVALETLASSDDDLGEVDEMRDLLLQMDDSEAVEALVNIIRQDVGQILRLDPERIDAQRSVHEFGMDSLMAMELAVAVEKRLGVQFPVMLLGEGPSVTRLAERIIALMRAQAGQAGTASTLEDSVRTVAAMHGQKIDDQDALADVVESLAASKAGTESS